MTQLVLNSTTLAGYTTTACIFYKLSNMGTKPVRRFESIDSAYVVKYNIGTE